MIFLLFFLISLFSQTSEDIYNRILTDKFFRGIVADNIIEQKKYEGIVTNNFDTYAQLREYVILWIEKNPKKAAELFSEIIKETGEYSVKTMRYEYRIHPKFKELIDKMEFASKEEGLNEESKRFLSSLMFEGEKGDREYSPIDLSHLSDKSSEKDIVYNYMNINSEKFIEEIRKIDIINEELKKYEVDDLYDIILLSKKKYRDFSVFVSSIKGNKKITEEQAKKLKEKFYEVSKYLALKALVIKYRMAEKIVNKISLNLKIIDLLHIAAGEIEKLTFLQTTNKDFNRLFFLIYKSIDNIEKESTFIENILEISRFMGRRDFSCFYDFLVHILHKYIYKTNEYNKILLKMSEFNKTLNEFVIKYLKDPQNIKDEDIVTIESQIKESKIIMEKVSEIKSRNRKVQYLFLDNFIPYTLRLEAKKIKFGLKYFEVKKENN
ncbi:MAG: hypothetical protein K6357_06675 [Elusimicrobiota bacterium]